MFNTIYMPFSFVVIVLFLLLSLLFIRPVQPVTYEQRAELSYFMEGASFD